MGKLIYGAGSEYQFEDRTLAHIKAAVGAKLMRQECFVLSWAIEPEDGSGRVSLWMSPSIPVQFIFSGSRPPTLNKTWVELLVRYSNSPRGLVVIPESEVGPEGPLTPRARTTRPGRSIA